MSQPTNNLDPELRGLLEEIAGDTSAHLLRAAPGQAAKILYPEGPGVSLQADLLTHAERHLLRGHRAEVGRVLHWQALVLLNEDPEFGPCLSRSITVNRELELPGATALKRRTEAALEGQATADAEPALELLRRCCSPDGRVRPGDLLNACLRVAPTDSARIALAVDHIRLGQLGVAEQMLNAVLARQSSDLMASYSWQNIGLVEDLRHDHARAAVAFERASEVHEERVAPLTSLFSEFLHMGDLKGAARTAQKLDDMVDPSHLAIRDYVVRRGAARRRGEWKPTSQASELVPRVLDNLGRTSHEIAQRVFA